MHFTGRMKVKIRAFTLIELLIVCGILGVITLAIYATFNSGIKIWQRINVQVPAEDLNIFFGKFSSDLRNSFEFTGITFFGTEDMFEFPTLAYSPSLDRRTVGQVRYSYDSGDEMLRREERGYSQIYNDESGTVMISLKDIKEVSFQYFNYDEDIKKYYWQGEWFEEGLPVAVKMELEFDDGTQIRRVSKTVAIPVSI